MKLEDYAINPMGRKSAVFTQRNLYKDLYTQKLDKILVRESGEVKYKLYIDKLGNKYYIHFKIPSEVVPKFYYDVVLMFYTINPLLFADKTLKSYEFKCYSNSPDYVYTFAHAMVKNNMFIDDLKPKMNKLALQKVAKERNPKDEIGYIKGLYFAYLLCKRYNLFDKSIFNTTAEPYSSKKLLDSIMDADQKIALRQEKGASLEKEERYKNKQNKDDIPYKNSTNQTLKIKNTKKVGKVGHTQNIKSVKRK